MEIKEHFLTNNNCYTTNEWITPTKIMLHSTACPGAPAKNFLSSWNKAFPKGQGKCVHAFVDPGIVYQTLPWTMRAWGCAGTGNNVAIQFEVCEPKSYADEEYFNKIKQTVIELVAYLCEKFNINVSNVTSHCEGYREYGAAFASNHSDLDHWWKAYFNYTMDDFRKELYEHMTTQEKFRQLGIKRFHDCGFKGAGVKIYSRENNSTKHGAMVEDVIRQIVPEADIKLKQNYQNGTDADIYTTSYFNVGDSYPQNKELSAKLFESGVFLCCAVGNYGEDKQTGLSKQECWTSVGACDIVNGKPQRMYYSSVTEDLDFMSLTNIKTALGNFDGTSCAAPVFASMCALVQQFFMVKGGRKLTNNELLRFIKDNCVDMLEDGHDERTGYGIFILPDPEDIKISNYLEEEDHMDEKYGYTVYNDFDAIPVWGQEAVEKAIKYGILKGTNPDGDVKKNLGLKDTELKMLVWLDRMKLFDNLPHPDKEDTDWTIDGEIGKDFTIGG